MPVAAVVTAHGKLDFREYPSPAIGPEEALLKVEMTGVCGSDPKYFAGTLPAPLPLILGHEVVGRIAAIGKEAATRRNLKEGDRVIIEACIPCGRCGRCLEGQYRFCKRQRIYGTKISADISPHLWGGYADYMFLDSMTIIHKIPESVPPSAAVLINAVLANGIQWVNRIGQVSVGTSVVIQGAGPQALAAAVAASEGGAEPLLVTGLSRDMFKEPLFRRLGADALINARELDPIEEVRKYCPKGADLVVDLTGSPEAIQASIKMVRSQGTVIIGGLTGSRPVSLPTDYLALNEIRVQGVFSKGHDAVTAAVRMVAKNRYDFADLVTHQFPLRDAEKALNLVGNPSESDQLVKAVLVP